MQNECHLLPVRVIGDRQPLILNFLHYQFDYSASAQYSGNRLLNTAVPSHSSNKYTSHFHGNKRKTRPTKAYINDEFVPRCISLSVVLSPLRTNSFLTISSMLSISFLERQALNVSAESFLGTVVIKPLKRVLQSSRGHLLSCVEKNANFGSDQVLRG